ncbi:putative inositol monophosphatase [Kineosphaera limosa NBRC 100340]|uniref:Putative inositol monophosphatase n=1 Tax=Kineosphaera limosa NBRC 100340 TaxID=1184609 RepID=K6XFB5_9MICO|nr:putative inositol monophosphatase [Kineosphaera limosa NBRC 100340]
MGLAGCETVGHVDTASVLALMQDVAAQVITPRFRSLASEEVMEKNPGDLVTIADREAEALITAALREADPDALIVGEEATASEPSLLDQLADAPRAWLIDPVDGTKNFVHGRPDHAVMVAELHAGECVRGWIWQPEHKLAFVAERGAGVWRNGERLTRPEAQVDPETLRVVTSRPSQEGRHGTLTLGSTAWCCGVDYPWLAEGRVDAIAYSRGLPWDHAAGSLLTEEIGGVIRHADGTRYRPGRPVAQQTGQLIAAASAPVWEYVADQLR